MIRKIIGVMLICFAPFLLFAQYKNNTWLLGYGNHLPPPMGGTKLELLDNQLNVTYENRNISIDGCYSALGKTDNTWFVYTNGSVICNKNNDTLINGNALSPGGQNNYRTSGFPITAMSLIVPAQNNGNILYIFHENMISGVAPFVGEPRALQLYYSLIDPTGGIDGTVYFKNQVLIDDTLEVGGLTACRHANGRDWWILVKRFNSSKYYTVLTTPNGPSIVNEQFVSGDITILSGRSQFSPDGNYFVTFGEYSELRIYDFDRCTGQLSNFRTKFINNSISPGLSISSNSRFIYISSTDSLWQLDMQSADPLNSQIFIAKYNGYIDSLFGFGNAFWMHWLGPDGKIYMTTTNSSRIINVINNPDEFGQACNFQQEAIYLPTYNSGTTPTYVNLNLLQVPNSICDSLDVGNIELKIKNEALKIMPNPNDGRFSLEFTPQQVTGMIYIYDLNGSEVYREYVSPYSSIKNLDLSNALMRGIFAVKLVFGDSITMGKVIIY
jgi:hypothetical protein